jgi:hypothetical protein
LEFEIKGFKVSLMVRTTLQLGNCMADDNRASQQHWLMTASFSNELTLRKVVLIDWLVKFKQ